MQSIFFKSDLNEDFFPNICLEITGKAEELLDSLSKEKYHFKMIEILRNNRNN